VQRRRRAASGILVATLLIATSSVAEAQGTLPSSAEFDNRFYFQPSNPQPDASESQSRGNWIRDLLIGPAEAGENSTVPPVSQQSPAPEKSEAVKGSLRPERGGAKPLWVGRAAYYEHPGRTAMGQPYNPDSLTAAHKSLALGTRLRVVNVRNRKSVIVEVTDRAPAKMKFAIDLSRASARAIGITKREGTALVALYKLD
jgi:rare lipoprotein A